MPTGKKKLSPFERWTAKIPRNLIRRIALLFYSFLFLFLAPSKHVFFSFQAENFLIFIFCLRKVIFFFCHFLVLCLISLLKSQFMDLMKCCASLVCLTDHWSIYAYACDIWNTHLLTFFRVISLISLLKSQFMDLMIR